MKQRVGWMGAGVMVLAAVVLARNTQEGGMQNKDRT